MPSISIVVPWSIVIPWSVTGFLLIFVIYIFLNPEKAQIWGSAIARFLSSSNNYFARLRITGKLQGMINEFAKSYNKEGSGIMPYNLKVNWIRGVDREALLKNEGVVIVRLGHEHGELERALAIAMLTFCTKALIPLARPYMTTPLTRSIDLVTTKKMLNQARTRGGMDYFMNDVLKPEIDSDANLCSHCQALEAIDTKGLLSRILLRELQELGYRVYPDTPNGITAMESEEFVSFLVEIVKKPEDEDVELDFHKNHIKVHVILVARAEKIAKFGFAPYLKQLERHKKRGLETAYILGLGDNIPYTKKIADLARKREYGIIEASDEYRVRARGRLIPAVCIAFRFNIPK